MKILMVKGKECMVDDDVYEWAKHFNWTLGHRGHVLINQYRNHVFLHRVIMDTPEDMQCDHRDRNPLNNQRENLRSCTRSQNAMNSAPKPNKHGFRGVTEDKRTGRFRAMISVEGSRTSLGMYGTPEEAARAYDKGATRLHGEYAILNFPS